LKSRSAAVSLEVCYPFSEAREGPGSEPAFVHHAARRRGGCLGEALKWPIAKATRKARGGVRTSSPATNGIAAFAVTASCIRRWYAYTLLTSTTKPYHQVCMSTSRAQFGSERNSHRLFRAASSKRRRLRRLLQDSERFRCAPRNRTSLRGKLAAAGEESPCPT
jgi:hypothetical protein